MSTLRLSPFSMSSLIWTRAKGSGVLVATEISTLWVLNQKSKIKNQKSIFPLFTYPLPPIHPLFTPPPEAHFDLTHPSFSGRIMVMRRFARPFPDLRSESARFDEAHPLTLFVYKVVRNFFKPSNFVHFRKVDRQAQDALTLGIGGRESMGEGSTRQTFAGHICTTGWGMRP